MAERQDERDDDRDETDEAEDSSYVEPDEPSGKDSLERIAVDFLCNHTYPFGSATDLTVCTDSAEMTPNRVNDAIADAMVAAAGFLERKFDNS